MPQRLPALAVRRIGTDQSGNDGGADLAAMDIRPVQVGPRTGSLWIIEQGVKPGERVVVEGLDKVRPGAKVKPEPASPSAPAGRGPSS